MHTNTLTHFFHSLGVVQLEKKQQQNEPKATGVRNSWTKQKYKQKNTYFYFALNRIKMHVWIMMPNYCLIFTIIYLSSFRMARVSLFNPIELKRTRLIISCLLLILLKTFKFIWMSDVASQFLYRGSIQSHRLYIFSIFFFFLSPLLSDAVVYQLLFMFR